MFKQSSVYRKSGRVSVRKSVYFSPQFAVPGCLHQTPHVYCILYIQAGPTVCLCVHTYGRVCVFMCVLSLAWGSSSCVRVSCSKCLNSQKRKKRRSKGNTEPRARRMGGRGGGRQSGLKKHSVVSHVHLPRVCLFCFCPKLTTEQFQHF